MSAAGFFKSVYLQYLSKPPEYRKVYAAIRRRKPRSIVELGVGDGTRAQRIIAMAQRYHEGEVRYTGVDLFEARDDAQTGLPLKSAYKLLRSTGAKVQLVPGDPFSALARTANSLTGTELLIISSDQDVQSLERAWFYVPRMITESSLTFIESDAGDDAAKSTTRLSLADVQARSGQPAQARRAA